MININQDSAYKWRGENNPRFGDRKKECRNDYRCSNMVSWLHFLIFQCIHGVEAGSINLWVNKARFYFRPDNHAWYIWGSREMITKPGLLSVLSVVLLTRTIGLLILVE